MLQKNKISVFVVDRCQFVREGVEALLVNCNDMQYIGGTDGDKGAVEAIKESAADIALVEVNTYFPKQVDVCCEIVKENPEIRLVCLLTEAAIDAIDKCITAGATGVLAKECSFDELATAIRKVSSGERYFGPKITAVLALNYADQVIYGSKRVKMLTDWERNIIRLTANGKSIIQIAEIIGKSSSNIGAVRQQIMSKLGIKSIAELTKFAIKRGLASLD